MSVSRVRPNMSNRKRILVVDDSQFLVSILATTLEGAGFDVSVAGDVREAVLSLKEEGIPDLLVLDLNLPDMQGDQACGAIRKAPACAKLPIVFISGIAEPQLAEATTRAQANGYLKKPFSPSSILRWIRDHAELLEVMARERGESPGSSPRPSPAKAPEAAAAPAGPPPAGPAPKAAPAAASAPPPERPTAESLGIVVEGEAVDRTLLVIEDSAFLRSVLHDTVKQAGYPVCLTGNMTNGTGLLKCLRPSLILLDVNLPDMQGDEACAILKNIPDCKDIPIILMTSGPEEVLRAKAEAAQADGYLRKPFTPASILQWLEQQNWVQPKGKKAGAFMPTGGIAGPAPAAAAAVSGPKAAEPAAPGSRHGDEAGDVGGDLIPLLLKQLGGEDAAVRAQAAYSLGEQQHRDALPRLRGMLRDPEAQVVADVLWALGEMKDAAAVQNIERLLESEEASAQDLNVRLRAVEALGRIGDRNAVRTIALCLKEGRPKDERVVAIQALADLGDATVKDDLQRIMFEDESEIQSYAREALQKITERTGT